MGQGLTAVSSTAGKKKNRTCITNTSTWHLFLAVLWLFAYLVGFVLVLGTGGTMTVLAPAVVRNSRQQQCAGDEIMR